MLFQQVNAGIIDMLYAHLLPEEMFESWQDSIVYFMYHLAFYCDRIYGQKIYIYSFSYMIIKKRDFIHYNFSRYSVISKTCDC